MYSFYFLLDYSCGTATAPAIVHGPKARLLDYSDAEHPVALQLGGSDPAELARAVQIARPWGYDEINLNCGCPSDRVQSGCFGAVLMERPALVAECVKAMQDQTDVPVTVKCRIGVDDQRPEEVLPDFLDRVSAAGVRHFVIHARKAWLSGLSPKENREVPPLRYDIAARIKQDFPGLNIVLNGGIQSLAEARTHLETFDGVMIGRAAYHNPYLLAEAGAIYGDSLTPPSRRAIAAAMLPYIERHLAEGARLHGITRHMLGLFHGQPGGRIWRRQLGEAATRSGSDSRAVQDILDAMPEARREPEPAPGGIY
jgi:tRNA-dihydrouridine synthase A